MTRSVLIALAIFALSSCEDSKQQADSKGALSAWEQAGFKPSDFKDSDPASLGATTCKQGKVTGLYVTLCEYADPASATAAKPTGEKLVGDHTGVALVRAKAMMVIVDTDKIDPSGRIINKLAKSFWELEVPGEGGLFGN